LKGGQKICVYKFSKIFSKIFIKTLDKFINRVYNETIARTKAFGIPEGKN